MAATEPAAAAGDGARPPSEAGGAGRRTPGQAALHALTAAALLLPGLTPADARAEPDDSVALQASRYRERLRPVDGAPTPFRPLTADSLVGRTTLALPRGDGLTLSYSQDTWSGATPITSAPASALGNRPIQAGGAGQLITVGASPMINGRVLLDAAGRPVTIDPARGTPVAAPAVVDTLSSASPETRRQLDGRYAHRLGDGAATLGGGVSQERDFRSHFVNVGRRLDFNDQLSTLTLGLSHTRSRIAATLDHDAAPYITKTAYAAQIENVHGQQVLHGRRRDWAATVGLTQVLGPGALLQAHAGHTRSAGDLANPYKVTSVVFAPTAADGGSTGVLTGDLRALLEQRPGVRRQWTAGGKLVLHHGASDGALHLGYGHFRDDWGIAAHRLEAEWIQPLAGGWQLSPRLRYYTQRAARFHTDYLVSRQAYRQVSLGVDGQPVITSFDPALLPAHFSSDRRLAGFGNLGAGLGVTRSLGRIFALDLGVDLARQSGALKAGGGGIGRHADFRSAVVHAGLRIDLDAVADRAAAAPHAAGDHDHGGAPHGHGGYAVPPAVSFAHGAGAPGGVMIGWRQVLTRQGGPMRRGAVRVDDAEVLARACGVGPCAAQPVDMAMRMQMLDLMWTVNERLALMLMPQHMAMDMDTRLLPGAPLSDTHVHFGRHESAGLGDTQAHALLTLLDAPDRRWVLGLGLSAPTGSTDARHRRTHQQAPPAMDYGMQTGSGTWDWLPSLTALGRSGPWSWGGQLDATLRGGRNASGYALGDRWQAQAWGARRLSTLLAATLRASRTVEGAVQGERTDLPTGAAPPDRPGNHGGRFTELGFGLVLDGLGGPHQGTTLGAELALPVRSQANGWQLTRQGNLVLSWSQHF